MTQGCECEIPRPDAGERRARVFGYGKHYRELRGRPFKGPGKPIHFVGRITTGAARRSKPRRLSTPVFAEAAEAEIGCQVVVLDHAAKLGTI